MAEFILKNFKNFNDQLFVNQQQEDKGVKVTG